MRLAFAVGNNVSRSIGLARVRAREGKNLFLPRLSLYSSGMFELAHIRSGIQYRYFFHGSYNVHITFTHRCRSFRW